jgi:hypothetical protein
MPRPSGYKAMSIVGVLIGRKPSERLQHRSLKELDDFNAAAAVRVETDILIGLDAVDPVSSWLSGHRPQLIGAMYSKCSRDLFASSDANGKLGDLPQTDRRTHCRYPHPYHNY